MHLEILDKKRLAIFLKLAEFKGFYLAGGTALALQIGHRISFDFDLFSAEPISSILLRQAEKVFSGFKIKPIVNNKDELTLLIDGIKLTFLRYPYRIICKQIIFKKIFFLSVREIAAVKAYTIGRRGSYKDYIDLYFILKNRLAVLADIIKLAGKKYKNDFNARLFLEQLIYLEDIKDIKIKFLKEKIDPEQLQNFLIKQVEKIKI